MIQESLYFQKSLAFNLKFCGIEDLSLKDLDEAGFKST